MNLRRHPLGLSLAALAAAASFPACGGSETSGAQTSLGTPTGSGGTSGVETATTTASTTSGDATTGAMGTTGDASTSGAVNTTAAVGTTGAGVGGATGAGGSNGDGGTSASLGGTTGDVSTTGDAGTTGVGGTAGGGNLDDPAPSTGCGSPAGLESGRASIEVGDKTREYILYVPDDYDPSHPHKLIFGWHPWGGSAQQTAQGGYFGLENVSNGQAILVAPEGQDFQNNGLGWGNENGEDIDFMHAMVDRFGSELCIDENRIFSTGFSFGAMFSFTLACAQNGLMRAIAPQAGNATTSGPCENGPRQVATMAFIGVDDTLLDGHRQAVDIFVERNGCTDAPVEMETSWCDGLASQYEPCTCVEYPDCDEGYPVIACEYQAGHIFAPSSGATLWEFFSRF